MNKLKNDDFENGLLTSIFDSEKVIWSQNGNRTIIVDTLSPDQEKVRARKTGQIANREMQHDGGIYHESDPSDSRDIHIYLYISHNRIVGLSIFEKRDHVCNYTWKKVDERIQKELKQQNPIWSLGLIWIHKNSRKRGIAKNLFKAALAHLKTQINEVGLYTPFSKKGEAWARAMFKKEFLIAK